VEPDQIAVLTGGAGGMAMASARRLIGRHPLLLADVSEEALEAAAGALRAEGGDVHTARCDVSDPDAVKALAEQASALGSLGALVHTAGLAPPGATDSRRLLDVNLAGTARVLDAFLPLAGKGTTAVCVASLAGYRGFAADYDEMLATPMEPELWDRLKAAGAAMDEVLTAYALSKRGVILEVRRRAADWGAGGARIVSISPGLVVDTTIGEAAATIHAGAYVEQSALRRPGYAEDIAGLVAFLLSDDAGYITGCDVLVDGGVVAHTLEHASPADREVWNTANYSGRT
jgi:NAD(P)-dependent dehydrogenase (short-subunit alcohol dehydrogenase family)